MRSSARAATGRGVPAWPSTARYFSMAPLRSPATISRWMAASRSRSGSGACCAASSAAHTAASSAIQVGRNARGAYDPRTSPRFFTILRGIFTLEPVAQAAHVAQVLRVGRIVLNLAAQVRDVVVDNARAGIGVLAPDTVDELIAAQHAAAGADKQAEQLELDGRQIDRASAAPHLAPREIHLDIAEAVRFRLHLTRRAAQQRFDARAQLARAERLGDVIVGAEFEPQDVLSLASLGRRHQNPNPDA